MKKLISGVLVLAMSLCSFGTTTCFADGSETTVQEVKTEQVAEKKVDVSVITKERDQLPQKLEEKQIKEPRLKDQSINLPYIFFANIAVPTTLCAGFGAVFGALLSTGNTNTPTLQNVSCMTKSGAAFGLAWGIARQVAGTCIADTVFLAISAFNFLPKLIDKIIN